MTLLFSILCLVGWHFLPMWCGGKLNNWKVVAFSWLMFTPGVLLIGDPASWHSQLGGVIFMVLWPCVLIDRCNKENPRGE